MASKRVKDGPHWVKAWISELSALTDQFRDIETGAVDFEALGREEYRFRMALSRRDFSNSERARKVWEDAVGKYQQRIKAASEKTTEGDANGNNAEESANACGSGFAEGGGNGNAPLNMNGGRDSAELESGTPSADVSGSGKHDDRKEKGCCDAPVEPQNANVQSQQSLFPAAPPPEKKRYGKRRHVMLTEDEGRKLREELGEDLEDAVEILDEYIHSLPVKAKGAKKNGAKHWMQDYEAKDHFVILHHGWARKRLNEMRTDELNARAAELRCSAAETNARAAEKRLENANSSSQPRQMYLTSDDISRRNAEEGWRQLQLMHKMQGNG